LQDYFFFAAVGIVNNRIIDNNFAGVATYKGETKEMRRK